MNQWAFHVRNSAFVAVLFQLPRYRTLSDWRADQLHAGVRTYWAGAGNKCPLNGQK